MAVLGCMTDSDLVVDAVLEIMYKAVVPWSEVVEDLVQQHLEKEHPKQKLLRESYRLMEIKKLLRGYGIRTFNLANNYQIMTLLRYMLKQEVPSSLEDALKLAQAYRLPTSQIYFLYFIQLHKQHQMVVAQVMVETLKFLQRIQKDNAFKSIQCENNQKMFEAIAHLQEDFDIFLTPEDYEDVDLRAQFQEQHITAYENTRARGGAPGRHNGAALLVANDADGKMKTISTEAGLHRLARQLQRSEQQLWADLALRALGVGKVEKALKICSELYQHHYNAHTGRVLFRAAQKLCQMLEENVPMVLPEGLNLPAVIHQLACQAATVCHQGALKLRSTQVSVLIHTLRHTELHLSLCTDLLLDCVELCKSTRFAVDVYRQCQIDDYGFTTKVPPIPS
ncbi:hypothetical protein JZ751_015373 [Albula glossodonta]|uniref:KNTC1 second ARM-repeats domain-containing protein n=1 Tax=Albula glossodonta TaxID=121402 RepID=A0A8T2MIX4_9TELE|nr:hypothetical protein JZ751_015373 [Albula glossodonta]